MEDPRFSHVASDPRYKVCYYVVCMILYISL